MAKTFLIFSCVLVYISLNSFVEGIGFFGFGSPKLMERDEDPEELIRGTPFNKQCKKKPELGRMTKLEVVPCEGTDRCDLVKDTNVTLKIDFEVFKPTQKVFGKLAGVIFWGAAVPFGEPENLCLSPQIECPLKPNQTYHYERVVEVKSYYPSTKLDVSITIEGDDGPVACVLIPVQIVKSSKTESSGLDTEPSYSWF